MATFLGTLAMWWLYFGTSSKDASEAIVRSDDPGRIGAYFHYVHAILVAGIIATAVSNDLVLGHPHAVPTAEQMAVLLMGPATTCSAVRSTSPSCTAGWPSCTLPVP